MSTKNTVSICYPADIPPHFGTIERNFQSLLSAIRQALPYILERQGGAFSRFYPLSGRHSPTFWNDREEHSAAFIHYPAGTPLLWRGRGRPPLSLFHSTFSTCSLICSSSSFIMTTMFCISAWLLLLPVVLISRPISCAMKPSFLPTPRPSSFIVSRK